jgi:hypothetical protein
VSQQAGERSPAFVAELRPLRTQIPDQADRLSGEGLAEAAGEILDELPGDAAGARAAGD